MRAVGSDRIERKGGEKGAQHHAPAAIRYLQPGWCRMVLHTPHICHECITRHLFISNYPWSSYVPRPHTTHRAHKAHTDCTVIDRAQKLLVHTWHYMCTLTGHCSAGTKFRVMCGAVLALRTVARWGGAPRCPPCTCCAGLAAGHAQNANSILYKSEHMWLKGCEEHARARSASTGPSVIKSISRSRPNCLPHL